MSKAGSRVPVVTVGSEHLLNVFAPLFTPSTEQPSSRSTQLLLKNLGRLCVACSPRLIKPPVEPIRCGAPELLNLQNLGFRLDDILDEILREPGGA